ncbi:MAG: hypothetical protein PHN64_03340 [Desulfovibrionaceae bacterium]|nr:hypothetical protein [Desulfovibrionaceae bacterium]
MLTYWSNVFAMLGVALIATAFFRPEDWQAGTLLGVYFIGIGAWFTGLSLSHKGGKK